MKPGSEQSFLYGNHVLKSGLGRITENTAQYQGVVVYSMADVPLVSGWHNPCAFQGWGVGKTLSPLLHPPRALEWPPSPRRSAGK